jgi:hypothetical protein
MKRRCAVWKRLWLVRQQQFEKVGTGHIKQARELRAISG